MSRSTSGFADAKYNSLRPEIGQKIKVVLNNLKLFKNKTQNKPPLHFRTSFHNKVGDFSLIRHNDKFHFVNNVNRVKRLKSVGRLRATDMNWEQAAKWGYAFGKQAPGRFVERSLRNLTNKKSDEDKIDLKKEKNSVSSTINKTGNLISNMFEGKIDLKRDENLTSSTVNNKGNKTGNLTNINLWKTNFKRDKNSISSTVNSKDNKTGGITKINSGKTDLDNEKTELKRYKNSTSSTVNNKDNKTGNSNNSNKKGNTQKTNDIKIEPVHRLGLKKNENATKRDVFLLNGNPNWADLGGRLWDQENKMADTVASLHHDEFLVDEAVEELPEDGKMADELKREITHGVPLFYGNSSLSFLLFFKNKSFLFFTKEGSTIDKIHQP